MNRNVSRNVPRTARWTAWGIIAIALVHAVYGFATMAGVWGDIAGAGVFDTVEDHAEREAAVWFVYSGAGFLALGTFALKEARATGRLPFQIALYLLGIGGTMIVLLPVSGGWIVLGFGLLALAARGGDGPPAESSARRSKTSARGVA